MYSNSAFKAAVRFDCPMSGCHEMFSIRKNYINHLYSSDAEHNRKKLFSYLKCLSERTIDAIELGLLTKNYKKKILNIEKQFEKYFSRTRNMNIMLKLEVDRSDTNNIRFQVFV